MIVGQRGSTRACGIEALVPVRAGRTATATIRNQAPPKTERPVRHVPTRVNAGQRGPCCHGRRSLQDPPEQEVREAEIELARDYELSAQA